MEIGERLKLFACISKRLRWAFLIASFLYLRMYLWSNRVAISSFSLPLESSLVFFIKVSFLSQVNKYKGWWRDSCMVSPALGRWHNFWLVSSPLVIQWRCTSSRQLWASLSKLCSEANPLRPSHHSSDRVQSYLISVVDHGSKPK